MKKISQIVSRIKEAKGLSKDKEVADALGISETALYNHKSRDSVPYKDIVSFCEEVSLSLDWLLTGEGPKYRGDLSQHYYKKESVRTCAHTKSIPGDSQVDVKDTNKQNKVSGRPDESECPHGGRSKSIPGDKNTDSEEEKECVRTSVHTKSIAGRDKNDEYGVHTCAHTKGIDSKGDVGVKSVQTFAHGEKAVPALEKEGLIYNKVGSGYLQVPFYDVQACAGGGGYVDTENITDYFAFRSRWVKGVMGLDPKQLALISAVGDSMEPALREGDLILVDLRDTQVIEDSIYILRLDDRLFAKRLQRLYNGTIIITSDNPVYEKQTVPQKETADLAIIGRAVWVGRRI